MATDAAADLITRVIARGGAVLGAVSFDLALRRDWKVAIGPHATAGR